MRSHLIDYLLWWATPVAMIAIAAYMLRGKLQRQFPFFFNFVVFQIAAFAVEFPLRNWEDYFYVYWAITALGLLVSFAVVVEVVQKVVDGTGTLRNWNIALYCWCALAVVALVAMWPPSIGIDNVTNGIFRVDRTVRVTQFALAFFMLMFGASVGVSKRSLVFGIAIGFGLSAAVNLLVMFSFSHHASLSTKTTLSRVSGAAYVISTLIWLAYVAAAAKEDSSGQLPSAA